MRAKCTTPASARLSHDPARAWLDHIPAPRRSAIANWFHYAVRHGAQTPEAVIAAVQETCARRQQWGPHADAVQVLAALSTDDAGAWAYARYVLQYEQLPYAERQKVKAERSFHFLKQTMVGKTSRLRNWRISRPWGTVAPRLQIGLPPVCSSTN